MANFATSGISSLSNISSVFSGSESIAAGRSGTSFSDVLANAFSLTEDTSAENNKATLDLLTGNTGDLSTPLIAAEKAEIALNLTTAIRNKALEAYKDIMNMQV